GRREDVERLWRQNEGEVDPAFLPIEASDGGNLGGDLVAAHGEGDPVAEFEVQRGCHCFGNADQVGAVVVGGPPGAGDELIAAGEVGRCAEGLLIAEECRDVARDLARYDGRTSVDA